MKKTILSILCLLTLSTNVSANALVEILERGTGPKSQDGVELLINYQLWLQDSTKAEGKGKLVEKNTSRENPSRIALKKDKIIAGLYSALNEQEIGSRLKVTVPPELGYGKKKEGEIPANSTLIYEIEIRSIATQK